MKLEEILRKAKNFLIIPLSLLVINTANAQFRQVSGNVTSVPSNAPKYAQIVFSNLNTLDSTVVDADSLTGNYSTFIPQGPYKQEVRVKDNYKYLDENFNITGNRVDSIETVEKFNTQSNIHTNGMFLIKILTGTYPGAPNTLIFPWKYQDRPIKIFADTMNAPSQDWKNTFHYSVNDIQTKFDLPQLYQEVGAPPAIGTIIHWVDETPTPGGLGETLITSRYPDGSPKIAEIYINKNFPANNSVMLREMMRALTFQSFSNDPQMIMYFFGSNVGHLHPGEGESGKRIYRFKHVPKDMTPYDTSLAHIVVISSVVDEGAPLPQEYNLLQNYPNPFNPTTKIKYSIPSVTLRQAQSDIRVALKVYDILGREVATLVNEEKPEGEYEVEFNAANLPSGIYFYQLRAGEFTETKKMVLLK